MESLDLRVLRQARDWRAAGVPVLLATVAATWGSSPRPVGSIMAIDAQGNIVGSVSGGCIEDDLAHNYVGHGKSGAPTFVRYGVTADEAHRFGLPCGGTVEVLLEYDPDAASLHALVDALDAGRLVRREVDLRTGAVSVRETAQPEAFSRNDVSLANTFGPAWRMLLIGAGQLSEYVATMAVFNGFEVTACDPRSEYNASWKVAGTTLLTGMPDDVVDAFGADRRSCIVALTHDPKLDDLALLQAVRSAAFYVGAIGSRRNQAARLARLREHFGLTQDEAARLRGPVGLYIGSKTPPEIAVSVMAEILAVKNGVRV